MENKIKLNLGSGENIIDGFENIDIFPHEGVTVGKAEKLDYPDESVDLIYSSHLLEHYPRNVAPDVLSEWYRVLKVGAFLRIAVPDFAKIVEVYQDEGTIMNMLHGGQRDQNDFHNQSYDEDSLSKILTDTGFINIYRYDWRNTEHANIDDYSQAYMPHMDKENGLLMSLNMEAMK